MFTTCQTFILKQQAYYPTNINTPPSVTAESINTRVLRRQYNNHNVNYPTPSHGYNHYYHPQMYFQLAMLQLHGNRLEGLNTPDHDDNNIHTLSTTQNNPIENNIIPTNT